MSATPAAELERALARVAAAETLLVATDFDGVLAPFVLDPLDARPQAGTVEDLLALGERPGTWVAVVSGRDLETLSTLTGLQGERGAAVTRIGSHGAQSSRDDGFGLTEEQQRLLAVLTDEVEAAVADADRPIRLEHKPSAVVVHSRGQDEAGAQQAQEIAERAAARDGVRLMAGKGIFELTVVPADKGSALRRLTDELGVAATVYLGDDVTDEHAFAVLGPDDLGIKVGDGETAAGHRVAATEDVPAVLRRLRELRTAAD